MNCLLFIFIFAGIIGIIIALTQGDKSQRKENHSFQSSQEDRNYWNALMVLDAAEHGVFWPGAETAFEELDEPPPDFFDDYNDEYYQNDYYADY